MTQRNGTATETASEANGSGDFANWVPEAKSVYKAAKELIVADCARQLKEEWLAGGQFKEFEFTGFDQFLTEPDSPIHFRIGGEKGTESGGLWPSGGMILLAAQAKAGKTVLSLNVVHSLITGDKFLGRFEVTSLGDDDKVAILNLEVSPDQYRRWSNARGIPTDPRVVVGHLRGKGGNVNLLNSGIRKRFVEKLKASEANILVIDPLGPIMRAMGVDENDNTMVGRMLDAFNELRVDTRVSELFLIHHSGHHVVNTGSGNGRSGGSRGASGFNDTPEALWHYTIPEKGEPGDRLLHVKGRDVYSSDSGNIAVSFSKESLMLKSTSNGDLISNWTRKKTSETKVPPPKSSMGRKTT